MSLVVAIIAAGVALWQGMISKQQLDMARSSESKTEKALDEVRQLSRENRDLIAGVKKEIEDRITRILDQRLENQAQSDEMANKFAEQFMGQMFTGVVPPADPEEQNKKR